MIHGDYAGSTLFSCKMHTHSHIFIHIYIYIHLRALPYFLDLCGETTLRSVSDCCFIGGGVAQPKWMSTE